LKKSVHLFNLSHLNIEQVHGIESSLVLLEILKQAPKLSSMTSNPQAVMRFFSDDGLC
jgi:hypothetical protein